MVELFFSTYILSDIKYTYLVKPVLIHMKFSIKGLEKGDILIEMVTA